jgi:hypothetical protein
MNKIGIKIQIGLSLFLSAPFLLWGIVCFLGGPDGKIGSLESIMYGAGFSAVGAVFVLLGVLLKRKL